MIFPKEPSNRDNGFSLLEILLVLSLFSLLFFLCFEMLNSIKGFSKVISNSLSRTDGIEKILLSLEHDFKNIILPRKDETFFLSDHSIAFLTAHLYEFALSNNSLCFVYYFLTSVQPGVYSISRAHFHDSFVYQSFINNTLNLLIKNTSHQTIDTEILATGILSFDIKTLKTGEHCPKILLIHIKILGKESLAELLDKNISAQKIELIQHQAFEINRVFVITGEHEFEK